MDYKDVNNLYYRGFEGEPDIAFAFENDAGTHRFIMWIGYFETLLSSMLTYESPQNEFLATYNLHEGWYEDNPWEINNLNEVIQLFEAFDLNKIPGSVRAQSANIMSSLPKLVEDLLKFLANARKNHDKVYILYD